MTERAAPADSYALEQYREYLRLLASHQIAMRYWGKVDPSGIVQETLWEAHQELARGVQVPSSDRLAWLRRILANNLADEVRRFTADKRDVGREVSLQNAVEQSSQRLEEWLAQNVAPGSPLEHDEQILQLVEALTKLPDDQRETLVLHYWSGWTVAQIATHLDRSRDAVASLLKRGLRQLRVDMGAAAAKSPSLRPSPKGRGKGDAEAGDE